MAYSAVVRRLFISCPGDIPERDLQVIHRAINRWNGIYGEAFGASVLPISWGMHAAAEFGDSAQGVLNQQLVDQCDICLALFANRLGTPTLTAESGTAEEISRISDSGRYVGVLRSRRAINVGSIDLEQAQKLENYLKAISMKALILEYSEDDQLSQRVDTILAAAIARDQGRAGLQLQDSSANSVAEVWPRIESSEQVNTDTRGKLTTRRNWKLVLANTGNAPAHNVRVSLEAESKDSQVWRILGDSQDDDQTVETLAPRSEIRFTLIVTLGMGLQARCRVSWFDGRGRQENVATVRIA